MPILNLVQGSDEWKSVRASHFTASEAPAMMGASKYMTRNDLLRQKSTGISQDVDSGKQFLFDRGHAAEAAARPIIEGQIGEDLFPVTVSKEVEGLPMLASLDGFTMDETVAWECKLYNVDLERQILNEQIEPNYYWQLEQQLLVSGADRALFTTSDGTQENTITCIYVSQPERRAALIAGWKQFAEDLKNYQPVEVIPAAVAMPTLDLPAVSIEATGSLSIRTNLNTFGEQLNRFIEALPKSPSNDQEFADCKAALTKLKAAEDALDSEEARALSQMGAIEEMRREKKLYSDLARTTRLALEKLVSAREAQIKVEITQGGKDRLAAHIESLNKSLGKPYMPAIVADWATAIKSKRTVASLQNAVDTLLSQKIVEATGISNKIEWNLTVLKEDAAGYDFLFRDEAKLVLKNTDDLEAIIKSRISDHKAAEEKRLEAEREKIRAEERDSIQRQADEVKRVSGLWMQALGSAVEASSKMKEFAAEIKNAPSEKPATLEPANKTWSAERDSVVAMLEDMTISELAIVRIEIAKIKKARTAEAS